MVEKRTASDARLLDRVVAHSRVLHMAACCTDAREILTVATSQLVTQAGDLCVGVWRALPDAPGATCVAWAGPETGALACPVDLTTITGSRDSQVVDVIVGPDDSWASAHGIEAWTCFVIRLGGGAPIVFAVGGPTVQHSALVDVKLAIFQGVAAMVAAAERSALAMRAQADAEEQRAQLQRLLDDAPAIVTIHRGPTHVFTFANRRFREVNPQLDPIGKTYREAFASQAAQGADQIFDRIYRTGERYTAPEYRTDQVTSSGATISRYFHLVWQPTRDAAGAVDGVLTHAVDVTTQVTARLEADAARARLEALVDAHDALVWEAQGDTQNIVIVAGRSSALPRAEPGQRLAAATWTKLVDPRDQAALAEARLKAWMDGDSSVEFRIIQRDGSQRWLFERARRFVAADGRPSVRGLIVDVTDRKLAEQARGALQERLLHAQKLESLGVLAGGIAHDFNNLLTAMMGHASLLEARLKDNPAVQANIDALVGATRRASELTRQMLAYSGRGQVVVEELDVSERTKNIVGLIGASLSKTTRLRLDLQSGLPLTRVDVAQFQQIIMNLVINGSDALEGRPGEVLVRTGTRWMEQDDLIGLGEARWTAPGSTVFIEVTDTGCGMDPATIAKIFDPFFTLKKEGRGLGLAAVQGIVRAHQGAIAVQSVPGRGSRFTIYLPALDGQDQKLRSVRPVPPNRVRRGSGVIMVVDDEEPVRTTARALLEHFGFRVVEAADGATGVRLLDAMGGKVDLVFLDMTMPGINGEEAFMRMRQLYPNVCVILSSGYTDEEDATQRMLAGGLAGFLQKPYTATDMQRLLDRVLVEVDTLH